MKDVALSFGSIKTYASINGTEDVFLNSADIKNINSTQQIKFKELTKRFYI